MTINTRKLAFAAMTAALYAALTIALGFIAYGPIQFRVAEALCVLPFFFPYTAPGLFVGCILANIMSPYPLDIIVGSIATLLAVVCTMQLGRMYRAKKDTRGKGFAVKTLACLPPVVFNAVIIGALIAWYGTLEGELFLPGLVIYGLQVGFGELVVMYALGLPLLIMLPRTRIFDMLSEPSLRP